MLNVVLVEPEIPPNTGNIIRLCANTGIQLHLIKPLGFALNDTKLKRAGLDYHEWASVKIHDNFLSFLSNQKPTRLFACETHGRINYSDIVYADNDFILFGSETRGLANAILTDPHITQIIRIPMRANSRSINLSNAVAIVTYAALNSIGFDKLNLA